MAATSQRIAKFLAAAGIASRRKAEELIADGRVAVDGEIISTPATLVTSQSRVSVDGKVVDVAPQVRVWLYHKPTGLVTTHSDPQGRPTVFDSLPKNLPRVISVGRLDINTEGLLILTTSGAFSRQLELPSNHFIRTYKVRGYGEVDKGKLEKIKKGVLIEGVRYAPAEVLIRETAGKNTWLEVRVQEGKNREVRKLTEYVGLKVNRLIRTHYEPFALDDIKPGKLKEIEQAFLAKHFKEFI